jgi:hypothetical protein
MIIKGLIDEDFINYKLPSMFLITCSCDWKCCKEAGNNICQNMEIEKEKNKNISDEKIFEKYISNPITKAIVVGGLEPFDQFEELHNLIHYFRENNCEDEFVIYTGYYPEEIEGYVYFLKMFKNIIIKFGRYIPNRNNKYDEILGVTLASDNQFARKIS